MGTCISLPGVYGASAVLDRTFTRIDQLIAETNPGSDWEVYWRGHMELIHWAPAMVWGSKATFQARL